MSKDTTIEARYLGPFVSAVEATAICKFLVIATADPDGLPTSVAGWQRVAEILCESSPVPFEDHYNEVLDIVAESPEERTRAALRPERERRLALAPEEDADA